MGHNHFKCFSMSGKILWQVKPDNQFPALTVELQLSLASRASAEQGVNVTNAPVLRGQSQEQKEEEQVEELADSCNKAGQNTPAPSSYTIADMSPGAAPQGKSSAGIQNNFVMLFNDLKDAILRQSYNEHRYVRIWAGLEHGEVNEERVLDVEVTQDKANFEIKLAREEAYFQLQQTQQQEEFQQAHLDQEDDFKSDQLQKCHDFEASLEEKKARFRAEVTQRRLAQQAKIGKESQGDLANHIHRVAEILVKTPKSAILLSTSLMVTKGAVIIMPIPTYHPPWQDQAESCNMSMKMPIDFTDEPNTKMLVSKSTAEKQTAGK